MCRLRHSMGTRRFERAGGLLLLGSGGFGERSCFPWIVWPSSPLCVFRPVIYLSNIHMLVACRVLSVRTVTRLFLRWNDALRLKLPVVWRLCWDDREVQLGYLRNAHGLISCLAPFYS
jgi:hypothetical protein